jgi:hypothetical protein
LLEQNSGHDIVQKWGQTKSIKKKKSQNDGVGRSFENVAAAQRNEEPERQTAIVGADGIRRICSED